MDEIQRTLLLQGKDLELLAQAVRQTLEHLKKLDQEVRDLRDLVTARANDATRLWEQLSRVSIDLGDLQNSLKSSMQVVNTTLNDRVMLDIANVRAAIERVNATGTEANREAMAALSTQVNHLTQELGKIKTALSEDEDGKVIRRIKASEEWIQTLTIRAGVIFAIGTPIFAFLVLLVQKWLSGLLGL